jgi:anti-anti-sigma regulatory factor
MVARPAYRRRCLNIQIVQMNPSCDEGASPDRSVVCPAVLSFSFNHRQSLAAVAEFARLAESRPEKIVIDFRAVERLNLGAGAVLMALAREARENGTRIEVVLPDDEEMQQRLAVCGLANVLEDAGSVVLPPSAILALTRLPRDPDWDQVTLEQEAGAQTDRVSTRLNAWLSENGYELDPEVNRKFLQIVSETLENAVYHSNSGWWICASVQRGSDGIRLLEVAVFNFGGSIAESLATSPRESRTHDHLESLRREHRRKGAFSAEWTEENLLALFAIQDGNSRFGFERERGGGTHKIVKIFQFISDVASNHPDCRLGWVSGSTAIFLDGRYRLGPSKVAGRLERDDIAFNDPNDLNEAPDRLSVVNLEHAFPGTLLKLQFPLREDYLVKQKV